MASAKRYLFIALSFALLMTVFAVMAPRAVHAITATLVQVVNTAANPVPAQVVNPSLKVDASGSSVNVSSMPSVQLDTSAGPITVRFAAPQRVAFECYGVFTPSKNWISTDDSTMTCNPASGGYLTPGGKRLIIEHVQFRSQLPGGQQVTLAAMSAVTSFFGHDYYFAPTGSTSINGDTIFVDNEHMTAYMDGGRGVSFRAARSAFTGTGDAAFIVTGYLEDCSTCY